MRIRIRSRGGKVVEADFRAFGCQATVECARRVTERIRGAPLTEVETLQGADLARDLALEPDRAESADLVARAAREAARNLRRKLG